MLNEANIPTGNKNISTADDSAKYLESVWAYGFLGWLIGTFVRIN